MSKQVRVNIRTTVNAAQIRRERRHGRDYIIVPSATLPDDVVMNDIRYPADEIEKSFRSLENTPAPLGHPDIEGQFVSASDPEGLARGWVGAWNRNVRRENGRVFLDKVIDVATAKQLEGGKAVLEAIEKGEPIHTSTGLYCMLESADGDTEAKHIARDIQFDHDAILLGEDGAATPAHGVGMMVNSAVKDGRKIDVINSAVDEAERELDWAGMHLLSALERRDRATVWERIKSAIMEAVSGSSEREPSANQGEAEMADDKQLSELSKKVNALEESLKPDNFAKAFGDAIGNAVKEAMKPVTDHVEAIVANQKADEDAKRATAINSLTKGGQWTEDELKDMPLSALNKLVEKAAPGKAAALNSAFGGVQAQGGGFKLPTGEKEA